jgi:hypothetical protein
VVCVITRFRLRAAWYLPHMYLTYLRMRAELRTAPGLIRYAFLIESPVTCCTLSIWAAEQHAARFSNVTKHIEAVRMAKRRCRQIWSARWRLDGVSEHANAWRANGDEWIAATTRLAE